LPPPGPRRVRGVAANTPGGPAGGQILGRQHAFAIALAQDGHHPLAEALGLLVVQVARETERVAAEVDEVLQGIGALLGRADHGEACARTHLGDAGPQVALDDLALGGELAHPAVGLGAGEALLDEGLLRLAGVTHQLVGELPRLLLGLPADDLQAHAEADVAFAAVAGRPRAGHRHAWAAEPLGV